MLNLAVARKYARALFEVSHRQGTAARVSADMESLAALEKDDPAFLRFLIAPDVPNDQKHAFVEAIFGPRLDPMVLGFLRLLVEKGRIVNLPDICVMYHRLSEEARGVIRAEVITIAPLRTEQESRLVAELNRLSGRSVQLEKKIDPAILGGVVVHLGDKIIDRSLRRGLRLMSETLLAAGK